MEKDSEIADRIIKNFDDMFFEYMNKILDEVRRQELNKKLAKEAIEHQD